MLLFSLLALTGATEPAKVPADVPPALIKAHMAVNFATATAARDHLIAGDVVQARASLVQLSDHVDPDLLGEAGLPYLTTLRDASHAAASATNATELGGVIGRVAVVCSGCHGNFGVALSPITATPPKDTSTHAAQASWYVSALWTGLIASSDEAWATGAGGLAKSPTTLEAYGAKANNPAAAAAVTSIRAQVAAAVASKDRVSRSAVLGYVIGACGSCHAGQAKK